MRPLEVVVFIGVVTSLLLWFRQPRTQRLWARRTPWIVLLVVLAQLLVEGGRWQLAFVYGCAVLFALLALRTPNDTRRSVARRLVRAASLVAATGGVALSAILAVGFPIFRYPAPTGPYGVGTTRLHLVDKTRVDSFAPEPNVPRELLAAVWYPADVPPGAPRDPFWPGDTDAEAAVGLPAFMFSHLKLVRAHSSADSPLAKGSARYPIIIYSHGYNSTPWQNVVQMEELASHGFVVVSIGHTYDASRLTFPDGRVVLDNSRTRRAQPSLEVQREISRMNARIDSLSRPDSIRESWRRLEAYIAKMGVNVVPSIEVWYGDTRFVLDRLTAIDNGTDRETTRTSDRFVGRLDLARIGVAGMSFGGSTAGVTCSRDSRCKAGMNIDGWQFGHIVDKPLAVPFLFMTRDGNSEFPVYFGSSADLLHVSIAGTTHGSFGDISIAMPLFRWIARPNLALIGTTDGASIQRIISRYMLAFFQQYLLGIPQPLLSAPAPPNELRDATLQVVTPASTK